MKFLVGLILIGLHGGVIGFKDYEKEKSGIEVVEANHPKRHFSPLKYYKKDLSFDESTLLKKERLPRVADIQSYDVTIQTYFPFQGLSKDAKQDFTFDGQVTIHFQMTNSTDKFPFFSTLNKITETTLLEEGKKLSIKSVEIEDEKTNLGYVQVEKQLVAGKQYELTFKYTGVIQDNSRNEKMGLFYNNYRDEGNEIRYLVGTQFEALHAREAIPLADDPHFKATISLTLIYPKQAKAYSNSDVQEEKDFDSNFKLTKFKPTPYMSDYLLAFSIGDYKEVAAKSKSGVAVRTIGLTTKGLDKSLNLAVKCLDAMEKLLDVPYNHSKLDHLNFVHIGPGADAMENYGLITYNDHMLSKTDSPGYFHRLYSVICHETAHQWFGNLVTNDNWGNAFLHEGFANYFQNQALFEDPETIDSETVKQEILSDRQSGLQSFSRLRHPVVTETEHFDTVIYAGGGAIFRMLNSVVGKEKFYEALKIYLTQNAYKTTTYKDLISAFEQALQNKPLCGNIQIREFLEDFWLQAAFPNVFVNFDNNQYIFKQKSSNNDGTLKWNVPLFVRELDQPNQKAQVLWVLKDNSICSTLKLDPKKKYDFNADLQSFSEVVTNNS